MTRFPEIYELAKELGYMFMFDYKYEDHPVLTVDEIIKMPEAMGLELLMLAAWLKAKHKIEIQVIVEGSESCEEDFIDALEKIKLQKISDDRNN